MNLKPRSRAASDSIKQTPLKDSQPQAILHQPKDELKWNSIQQESFPPIYFTLDLAGTVLAVNPLGAAGWKYSVEELIAQSIFSLFHPDDRARLQVEFTALVQHPTQVVKGKFRLLSNNGRSLSVNVTVQALQGIEAKTAFLLTTEGIPEYQLVKASSQEQASKDDSGANRAPLERFNADDQTVLAKYARPCTNQMQVVKSHADEAFCIESNITVARQASEECLHFVLENMPVMMDAFDADWNIILWNRECERVTGYKAEEIVGNSKAMELLYPNPEYRQQMIAAWDERGNDDRDWEREVTCKDGSVKIIAWSNLSERFPIPGWTAWSVGVDVTERKRAEDALHQQIQRERLVGAIAQRIHQSLNLEEILNTAVTQVRQFLSADRVLVYRVWHNGTGSAVTEAVLPGYPAVLGRTFPEEVFPQESQQLYRQGRILAVDDIEQANLLPCLVKFAQQFRVRAKLVVPILQGEQLWGLLIAHQCRSSRQWQYFEIELLKQLATQLAIAIQQSELYKQTQYQFQREQTLNRMIQSIRKSLDLKSIFSSAAFEIANLLQADRAEIVQYMPEQKLWLHVADYRQNLNLPTALGIEIPDEGNEIAARLKRLEVVRINDVSVRPDKINQDLAQRFPGSWLLVPLHFDSSVWGSLTLVRNREPFSWQDSEVELTRAVAAQLALAIQQSQLFRQVQRLNANLERQVQARTAQLRLAFEFEATLKRITDRVRDSLDEAQILQTAVQELTRVIGVKSCSAALYDLDKGISTICYEYTTSISPTLGQVVQMTTLSEVYTQLLKGECFQFCSIVAKSVAGQVAKLVCPILDNQGVLGDLWLINHTYYAFAEQDIRLVQQVANQCAIAIRQARLYQAAQAQVEELEKLNHLKDDFLSTVSHELRTPVCNIKMAAQMLEIVLTQIGVFDAHPNTAARYFQILQDECQREISLINNLLDLSRLEAGTEPLMLTTIDPRIWILSIAEPFAQRTELQQQKLQLNIPAKLPALTTDLSDLERILTEVLNNACKYTPPEGTITLSAQATADSLQVSVSNTGIEIPHSELTRIFDKFYRIPNNDPWKHGGIGLGLALVKKLVEHLKGTIQAKSDRTQTTFTLEFPLTRSASANDNGQEWEILASQ